MGAVGLVAWCFVLPASALTPTGDTATGGTDSGTVDTPTTVSTGDSGLGDCPDCNGAADLVGEKGGSPCEEGCSTSGAGLALNGAGLAALLLARRRTQPRRH